MNNKIEIDITYQCNLNCINCNRMCSQAPSKDMMYASQIYKFINHSMTYQLIWDQIRILGGEPTLHPDLNDILQALLTYQSLSATSTILILFTNGYGPKVKKAISKIPKMIKLQDNNLDFNSYRGKFGVIIADHWKKEPTSKNYFVPINSAPIDDEEYKSSDFSQGCKQIEECGIGLTPYGYYPCSVAGAIDRVVGYNKGIKDYNIREIMKLKNIFCPLCGMFKETSGKLYRTYDEEVSITWTKILDKYKNEIPKLDYF